MSAHVRNSMRDAEKAFLTAALAALPRIAEIINGYPPDDQAGALEIGERRFTETARFYGCSEIAAQSRVLIVMNCLRKQVEAKQTTDQKLHVLLQKLTQPPSALTDADALPVEKDHNGKWNSRSRDCVGVPRGLRIAHQGWRSLTALWPGEWDMERRASLKKVNQYQIKAIGTATS